MTINIDKLALEKACKEIIETILICLPNAFKGTVYRIGGAPDMIATRITSGVIHRETKTISWGLPESSDYNPPGKAWKDYRDEPNRPLEAMAWCVELQKSWTAEDPRNDVRSVRLQVHGAVEDYHHMEPVLVRKRDLYAIDTTEIDYPRSHRGETIWRDTDYAVVAVIKIRFQPQTIFIGSPETKFIKRLSRALGTELLSYQLKEESLETMRQLAQDKIDSCNLLADSIRNAVTKSGLIFSLIKLEIGFLREQWERIVLSQSDLKEMKMEALRTLSAAAVSLAELGDELGKSLVEVQNRFLELALHPKRGENWVNAHIEEKWNRIFAENPQGPEREGDVREAIRRLKESLFLGTHPDIIAQYDALPESLKMELIGLLYADIERVDLAFLERVIRVLEHPSVPLPSKEKSRKTLIHLKTLAEVMGDLEERTNVVLQQFMNGFSGESHSHSGPTVADD